MHPPRKKEDKRMAVLTANGEEFAVSPKLQEILAYTDDGSLYVAQAHVNSPTTLSFISRLKILGREFKLVPTTISHIRELYIGAKGVGVGIIGDDETSKIIKEVRNLIAMARHMNVSDIHIRVYENNTEIWMRMRGSLRCMRELERTGDYGRLMTATIYNAMADVSDAMYTPTERQDARISQRKHLPDDVYAIRIATSPMVGGEYMVMRLLYQATSDDPTVETLGYHPVHVRDLKMMIATTSGIAIIAGPTGSGKSTTLQKVIQIILKETNSEVNVITVEDPPEYPISGSIHTPVTGRGEDRNRLFAESMRQNMRLDPDVIIRMAMTGHQVWTTVHANTASLIMERFSDLLAAEFPQGVDPMSLIADPGIVMGLVFQRLVKVSCPECVIDFKEFIKRNEGHDEIRRIQSIIRDGENQKRIRFLNGVDHCKRCNSTGIVGRTVVAETIYPDHDFHELMRRRDRKGAVDHWLANLSGVPVQTHAMSKVLAGTLDWREAQRQIGLFKNEDYDRCLRLA
jgi:type II secretory ATPase GspE/PulE/Tfp pilus assembly ATPase PilB-like protein